MSLFPAFERPVRKGSASGVSFTRGRLRRGAALCYHTHLESTDRRALNRRVSPMGLMTNERACISAPEKADPLTAASFRMPPTFAKTSRGGGVSHRRVARAGSRVRSAVRIGQSLQQTDTCNAGCTPGALDQVRAARFWLVLAVPEGRESAACAHANALLSRDRLGTCFAPRSERLHRQQGAWRIVVRTLFPGYLFLACDDSEAACERLALSTSFLHLLGDVSPSASPAFPARCVTASERALLSQLIDGEGVVRMSRGVIEEGRVRVSEGPLAGREELISRIDRHKRIAQVGAGGAGERFELRVGLEITAKC